MMLRLVRYKLYVKCVSGQKVFTADALPCAYTDSAYAQEYPEIQEASLPMNEARLGQLRSATENNETLQRLKEIIEDGWSTHRKNMHLITRQ